MSYESGLIHTVAVDAKGLASQGARGGDRTAYAPVAGLEAVPCRLGTPNGRERQMFAARDVQISHKLLLAGGIRLTNLNRLRFVDQVDGTTRNLIVHAAYDPDQTGTKYVALCEEIQP